MPADYHDPMSTHFLEECIPVLNRTPLTLDAMLRGLPGVWTEATEGPGTWSPCLVLGHLIHGEKTDWMTRLCIILDHGPTRPFDPFDMEAHLQESARKPIDSLLDEFAALRLDNLTRLRSLNLQPEQLDFKGTHPELGEVTLRQLLATWTAHDLGHILQISRVMAKRMKEEVGPWAQYMSLMK